MPFSRARAALRAARSPQLVVLAVALASVAGCGSPGEPSGTARPEPPITSTTRIASAGVLGNDRRPDESCAPDPAPLDDGPAEREVRNAAGHAITPPIPETTLVRADPQRIVALSGDQLDALCALGLQSRIVGAALPDGSTDQPSYLGTVIHDLPGAGSRSEPDLDAIQRLSPDLILGSVALTPQDHPALSEIAPTVFSGPPGAAWKDNLRTVGAATGRSSAADRLIDDFDRAADRPAPTTTPRISRRRSCSSPTPRCACSGPTTSRRACSPMWASIDLPANGSPTSPMSRWASPTRTWTTPRTSRSPTATSSIVSFASAQARDRAADVMHSDAWKRLSANRDDRVFAVNNEVWQTGQGIVAARGILADLRLVNAPIN